MAVPPASLLDRKRRRCIDLDHRCGRPVVQGHAHGGTVKIICYGRLGEAIGRETELDAPAAGLTLATLREWLAQRHPHAADEIAGPFVRACVGDRIVGEDHSVAADETVEFFPPLSGG
jgi:molybdopterin converting factor small subunit